MTRRIKPGNFDVSLSLSRAHGDEFNNLRWFVASVSFDDLELPEPVNIGSITGWLTRDVYEIDLFEAADAISSDAEPLGGAAEQIIDAHPHELIDSVIMIDRMRLVDEWRGHRLSGILTANLMNLLQVEPTETVVVLQPEPQKPGVGPMDYGDERDSAMARLHAAYWESGFRQWREGPVWWLPLKSTADAQK